jgi:hypothetical protein
MNHEQADLNACAASLGKALGVPIVRLHVPIGQGEDFKGYVDLVSQRAHTFGTDGSGQETISDVPAELKEEAEAARLEMVEAVAEADDVILEKYLEEGELTEDEVLTTLTKGIAEGLPCSAPPRIETSAVRSCSMPPDASSLLQPRRPGAARRRTTRRSSSRPTRTHRSPQSSSSASSIAMPGCSRSSASFRARSRRT